MTSLLDCAECLLTTLLKIPEDVLMISKEKTRRGANLGIILLRLSAFAKVVHVTGQI